MPEESPLDEMQEALRLLRRATQYIEQLEGSDSLEVLEPKIHDLLESLESEYIALFEAANGGVEELVDSTDEEVDEAFQEAGLVIDDEGRSVVSFLERSDYVVADPQCASPEGQLSLIVNHLEGRISRDPFVLLDGIRRVSYEVYAFPNCKDPRDAYYGWQAPMSLAYLEVEKFE